MAGRIMEVLEVSEFDLPRLLAEAEADEETAASKKTTKASQDAEIKGKQSEIRSLSVSMLNYNEDKASVGEELDAVLAYLDKLEELWRPVPFGRPGFLARVAVGLALCSVDWVC